MDSLVLPLHSGETETHRLERHAETFTQRLEKERRLGLQLDETVKATAKRLQEKQAAVKSVLAQKQVNGRLQEQAVHLESKLNSAKLELGDLLVTNRRLRSEIDSLRKGNVESLNSSMRLTSVLEQVNKGAVEANKRACRSVLREQGARHRLLSLQDTRGAEQLGLTLRLKSLHGEIAEDRKARKELLQRLMDAPVAADMSESGLVSKHLCEKWQSLVRDKRKELSTYQHYVAELKAGFDQMQTYSNIETLPGLVQSFLNFLERQREIHKHIVILSELIEEVSHELTTARLYIDSVTRTEHFQNAQFTELQNSRLQELESMHSAVDASTAKLALVTKEVEVLQGPLSDLYRVTQTLDLRPRLSDPVEFNESSEFTVDTAPLYLVQLEELTHQMTSLVRFAPLTPPSPMSPKPLSLTLDTANLPVLDEEDHPLSPIDFRRRAQQVLGYTSY